MTNILKEAIADAKAVKEIALANAKFALEEAFTPRLQSMIATKLSEESEEDDEDYMDEGEDGDEESVEPAAEEPAEEEEPVEEEPVTEDDDFADEDEIDMTEGDDEDMDDNDPDLMEILRQLEEEELDSSDIGNSDNKKPSTYTSISDPGKGDLFEEDEEEPSEDDDLQEIIRALREEEEADAAEETPDEEPEETEEVPAEEPARVAEAYAVIKFLRAKLNEVNLLNSKLLFSNKLFRSYSLTTKQKMTVIENFDRAGTLREVKLIFATLSESLRSQSNKPQPQRKKTSLKEGYRGGSSKPSGSTRPAKTIITESDSMSDRFRKLANINKD